MNIPILEIKNLHAGVEGKQILKGLTLTINPDTYLVEKLDFSNALGEESRFTFTQVKLEVPSAPDFFTFTPPPGVQVVRETPGS